MTRSDSPTILSEIQVIQSSPSDSSQSGSIGSNDNNVIPQQQEGQTSALDTDQQLVGQGQLVEEDNVSNNTFPQPNSLSLFRNPSRSMALLVSITTSFLGIAGVVVSSNAGLIAGAVASGFVAVAGAGAGAFVLKQIATSKQSSDFSSRDPNRSQENIEQQQDSAVIDIGSVTAPQPVEVTSDQNQVSGLEQNQPQRTQSAPSKLGIVVEDVAQLDQQASQRSQSF